jgi:phenylpropionate dioxygenase-like ring-hydroxylating dioxygenase large terminal subunit
MPGWGAGDIDRTRLRQGLAAARLPASRAGTLPPACYADPALFRWEQESLFRRTWVGVGRVDRWAAPGDYSALDIGGAPIIVLRDNEGALRAFANTCRHRGSKLLEGDGNCGTIRCPFHRWTYALDGRLLMAPRMDKTENFALEEHGLIPLRADACQGFAFVCFDDDVEPLADWLGDFPRLHTPWSLGDMVSTRRREFEVACNWKSFLEVFNEYYHLPYVHPESIGELYDPPDDPDEVHGNYASQFGTTKGSGALLKSDQERSLPLIEGLAGDNRRGTRYTWMFPNLTFAAGTESVWVYETYALAPDRTRVGMTACFPAETSTRPDFDSLAQHYYERLDAAIDEDIPALERQQLGLDSPFARPGRFSRLEPSVASFARWYSGRLLDEEAGIDR